MQDLSEGELVRQFREDGDDAAFAELFQRHRPAVYRGCLAVLRNATDAQDLAQETFLKAREKIEQFRGGSFSAWLFSIARHLCLNYLKSRFTRPEVPDAGASESRASSESYSFAEEVLAVLEQLPEDQRICLKLFYMEEYSAKEICEIGGYTYNQVKSYIQNGKRQFERVWTARAGTRIGA